MFRVCSGGGALTTTKEQRECADDEIVDLVKLDDELKGENVTFIKVGTPFGLDVFKGSENLIKRLKPKLATVMPPYHDYEIIWKIPEYLWGLNPNYQLYMRHYSNNFSVTTLFAIPE